jgi:hypothetical protein
MSDYKDLLSGGGNETLELSHGGYAFEFADISAQLVEDPSFSIAIQDQLVADVSAVAVLTPIAPTSLNGFITLNVDSVTPSVDEPKTFTVDATKLYSALNGTSSGPNLAFSDIDVSINMINSTATDNTIKDDVVRNMAYQITGGYGASDIFNNEAALISDVEGKNTDLNNAIKSDLESYIGGSSGDVDPSGNLNMFDRALNNLFAVIIDDDDESDGTPGRRTLLFNELNDVSGNGSTTNSVHLKFASTDVLTFKVSYKPATPQPTNAGSVDTRSYRVVLPLTG